MGAGEGESRVDRKRRMLLSPVSFSTTDLRGGAEGGEGEGVRGGRLPQLEALFILIWNVKLGLLD